MKLLVYNEIDELINAVAASIEKVSQESITKNGQFNFVLSGGSTPRRLYELLASQTYKNKIDWQNTYFFFGDERYVPEGDSQRNSLMAKETLLDPLKIQKSHIFNVDTTGSPEESAKRYAEVINVHFQDRPVRFDYILLGVGDNAHTASLFPHTSVLKETEATIKSVFVKEVDMDRITMTAPLINQAENIAFLVFGKNKAEAVHHVLDNTEALAAQYPAMLIHPTKGELYWFLDKSASALIKSNEE